MTSPQVRSELVEPLKLDLVGPDNDHAFAHELLPDAPSRWYLSGFLVPSEAPADRKTGETSTDENDSGGDTGGTDHVRLMVRNNEGLTKAYNRFHDPEETSPDILRLRALHAAMDRAVLEAYGWSELIPQCQCEFLLDYEDEEDGAEETGRRRKKPWRFRWPDEVRDEVLARLLKLNAERAEQEALAGLTAAAGKKRLNNPRARPCSAAPPPRRHHPRPPNRPLRLNFAPGKIMSPSSEETASLCVLCVLSRPSPSWLSASTSRTTSRLFADYVQKAIQHCTL